MPQKASTPWSTRTVAEGGTDSPVGDLVPVPDEIKPVVNTGFISLSGKYTGLPSDDLQFTFQDPGQAMGPGADVEFNVDMLQHDIMILAMLDASGNDVNIDLLANNTTTPTGPYSPFVEVGVNGAHRWTHNSIGGNGDLKSILSDTSETLSDTWQFYHISHFRGTQIRILIHNNSGADTATISTAYLRLL